MVDCPHRRLEILPKRREKLRCTHCHLIISVEELGDECCPECREVRGIRHHEFEEVEEEGAKNNRYRCEDCGALIEWQGTDNHLTT